jgi:hypothetical protein
MVAGDTVLVAPGNYGECVVTAVNGDGSKPIIFRANPGNDPMQQVIVKQFRVMHRYIVIEGFNVTGSSNSSGAGIRLDFNGSTTDSSNCIITNNTIRDGVYLLTRTASFGSNYVRISDGDFNATGFTNGSLVWFGSDSLCPYTNHDIAHTVYSNSTDGTTMYVSGTLTNEPGPNFAVIFAGQDNSGYEGILDIASGSRAPTNTCIVGNTFSNLFGAQITLFGSGYVIRNNKFFHNNGWTAIHPQGPNAIIQSNLFLNNTHFEFFTPQEMATVTHPLGGNYMDYQGNCIEGWTSGGTNCVFDHNWMQNCDEGWMLMQQVTNRFGWLVTSNVFVGTQLFGSIEQDGVTLDHNTFYRVGFGLGQALVFGAGGRYWPQTNLVVKSNAFVSCGSHYRPNYEGYITLGRCTNYSLSSNFCALAETMGWGPIVNYPGGISVNGGDPVFVNARDPLGPDGLPFTDDDGLRPLPNSPLAISGLGAEPPIKPPIASPLAHFSQISVTNWQDDVTTNFNPAWAAAWPHDRNGDLRPWTLPEALGHLPVVITFNAGTSIDGLSPGGTNNAGITSYNWSFGDGSTATTATPVTTHAYQLGGELWVTLTVTNSAGGYGACSNAYRVLPAATLVKPPSNLRFGLN